LFNNYVYLFLQNISPKKYLIYFKPNYFILVFVRVKKKLSILLYSIFFNILQSLVLKYKFYITILLVLFENKLYHSQ